jgi:competence protein ComEC
MWIFASLAVGAALFYLQRFFPCSSHIVVVAGFLLFAVSGFRSYNRSLPSTKNRLVLAAAIILPLIFGSAGYWRAASSYEPPPDFRELSGRVIAIKGSPSAEPLTLRSNPARFLSELDITEASAQDAKLNIEKMRLFTEHPMIVGKAYLIMAKIPADSSFLNPGSRDWLLSGYAVGVEEAGPAERNFLELARDRLNACIASKFSPDVSSFLMSIITGERSGMSGDMKNAFNVTGLAHILSISGAHFGLLLFILFQSFRFLVRLLPLKILSRMSLYCSPSQVAAALSFPVLVAYLGISTMEFPAVRSFIMITLFLFGLLIHRKGFWMNTLLFAAALIVMIQPDAVIQLSCQLSFLAVLCIGFYADFDRRRMERKDIENDLPPPRGKTDHKVEKMGMFRRALSATGRYLIASSMISVFATFGTAPIVAYSFNYFSVISPLSNLMVTPFIGFVILPVSLFSSFIYLVTGFFPFSPFIEAATRFSLDMIGYMGAWDYAAIPVPTFPAVLLVVFYVALLLYAAINAKGERSLGGKRSAAILAIAVLPLIVYACFGVFRERGMSVTFLDVGQGDSAVMELPDGKVMVVDTGKNGFQTAGFLRYRGHRKVDVLVLTHGHPDHAGGVKYIQSRYPVGEIWDNDQIHYADNILSATARRGVERGDTLEGGNYKITAFHPYKGFYTARSGNDAENNQSVVLKIEGRKLSILFTGDISAEAEDDIMHLGRHLKSMVIKVPHHGSRKSLAEGLLQYAGPDIAVISAGRNNMFGHPHPETLERLEGIRVYRTDRDGAIGITETPDGGIKIKTRQESMMKEAPTFDEEVRNIRRLFDVW